MPDSDHDPTRLLRFDHEAGRILYGEERFLLLSADAIGKLRRELAEVLGPIMAHEVLFRFGFHDGETSARTLRGSRPDASPLDLLLAGPRLHMMEGMVRVRIEELRYEGDFDRLTGVWEDSFEAEQVLGEWGHVEWTACWILTGFASGYASEIAGQDLLCVERACRARGDECCRFEILPAEQFPGLGSKVRALREGRGMTERMRSTMERVSERAFNSAAFLSRLLTDSADAILTVDADDVIRTWNRGAEDLLGYSADEAIGRHFSFLVPADLLTRGEIETIRMETEAEGSLRNYETRRLTKNGEEVYVSLTRTAIQDVHGKYVGCSAILRDITERKKLVEKLIQVESLAEIGELAAQVAHEIKNPLAGISAAIQIVVETVERDDPRHGILLEVLDHVRRLDDTVLALLRFTRPYLPGLRPTAPSEVLAAALSILEATEEFREIEVHRDFDPTGAKVPADPQQLVQVFLNLLLNAAQSLREDRRIFVRTRRDGEEVLIEVEDRGIGIPTARLKQIFRPFFTSRNKGTGLGLPIARKIIEGHGGTLTVESEPGVGSSVRVRRPVARGDSD